MTLWPKDATGFVEKAAYVGMKIVAPALYLFMVLSAFGLFNNMYADQCREAGFWWKIPGIVCLAASLYTGYKLVKEETATRGNVLILFVCMALSLLLFAGFYS